LRKGATGILASPAARFLRTQGPILALLLLLAILAFNSFDNYVASDDLKWVTRSIGDSARPWRVFSVSDPLFGHYYRPMPQLAWLVNYYFWGFNFNGHQAMYLVLWLAVVWLVYQVGVRIAGRGAGFIAAALFGFNDIYLMMASWKSWYTSMVELAAVLAWAVFYLDWLETRTRGKLIGWMACALVAVLSRELAPLVISAAILFSLVLPALLDRKEKAWKGKLALAAAWLLLTGGVLAALPSYRESFAALLHGGSGAAQSLAWGNIGQRFWTHSGSIFFNGISRYLLYLAALLPALNCLRRWAGRSGSGRDRFALIGALLIGSVLLALPANANVLGPRAWEFVRAFILPLTHGLLLAFLLFAAFTGDRWDRMLGASFLVSFVPILFLQHSSNAYHMMAFAALALFTGKQIAPLVQECWGRLRSRLPQEGGKESWIALSAILLLILAGQAVMLVRDVRAGLEKMRTDVTMGRAMRAQVDETVAITAFNVRSRKVSVANDPYSLLAGQILNADYGFEVAPLEKPGSQMVGLRLFDVPLRVYSHAVAYSDALFQRYNHPLLKPDPGFETLPLGGTVVEGGRTGRHAMAAFGRGAQPVNVQLPSSEFTLPPGAYVFGGFVKVEAEAVKSVTLTLAEQGGDPRDALVRSTPPAAQSAPQWELLWEDAATPRESRFIFRILDVEGLKSGRVLVDDIFLCPVGALIADLEREKAAAETPPADDKQP